MLSDAAKEVGYEERTPTPLGSPFWNTTFAPSSSEVMFREMANTWPIGEDPVRLFTTCPCIRYADMAPWSDGNHFLHFTMFTAFVLNCINPIDETRWFLELLSTLGAPTDRSCFTYFSAPSPLVHDPAFEQFGVPLLSEVGIVRHRMIPCRGLANYQINLHKDDAGLNYRVWGPRIEVIEETHALEYATLCMTQGILPYNGEVFPPVLCLVTGVERLATVAARAESAWHLPAMKRIADGVSREVLGRSGANSPFRADIQHLCELVASLLYIAEAEPSISPAHKGVRDQLRRILKATSRKVQAIGIDPGVLVTALHSTISGCAVSTCSAERVIGWLETENTKMRD